MMELIKSKQNGVITKNVIRTRKLHQSMLRFTRIYQDENGKFQRDIDSEEYSCVMTESKKEKCCSLRRKNMSRKCIFFYRLW